MDADERTTAPPVAAPADAFEAACALCGEHGRFVRHKLFVGGSYPCPACRAVLRYQGQARVLVDRFGGGWARCLTELVRDPAFRQLRVWEPGELGPLRRLLRALPGYVESVHRPGVPSGTVEGGTRYEDLHASSFDDASFDLVVTSDVFEHVRHPDAGFAEMRRVLRPGGLHVFSLPLLQPLRETSVPRVDTSGPHDVPLLPEVRHRGHLVYTDFGLDLLDRLAALGLPTELVPFRAEARGAARLVTLVSVRRDGPVDA